MAKTALDRILKIVNDQRSVTDLQKYFDQGGRGQVPKFSVYLDTGA